jgi:hypothetical protein
MIKISDIWTWEEWKQIFDKQRKENENEDLSLHQDDPAGTGRTGSGM